MISPQLKADEATCREVLQKCDSALRAQEDFNKSLNEIIKDQSTVIDLQKQQLDSQSIWKPIAIGSVVVIGLGTIILVLRK